MKNEEFVMSITELERGLVLLYADLLKDATKVLEIGSGWGIFARSAMMANEDLRLTTIDKIPHPKLTDFMKNTEGFSDRIRWITGDSREVLKDFDEREFDVVFVDGDHGYEGAYADLENALRLVRKGGIILVDDVLHHNNWKGDYGVMKALRDWMLQKKLDVKIFCVGNGVAMIQI